MDETSVVVVGCPGVGKSAATVQFVQGIFVEKYDPTIEDIYRKLVMINNKQMLLNVLDTCGYLKDSLAFTNNRRTEYEGCNVVMLYDITSRESFDRVASYFFDVSPLLPAKCILVGNKTDLEHLRVVPKEEAEELAALFDCKFVEITCRDNTQVTDMFTKLLTDSISKKSKHKGSSAQKTSERQRCAQM